MKMFQTLLILSSIVETTTVGSEIIDNAHCFSPAAVDHAQERLSEIESKTGIPTVIETFATAMQRDFSSAGDKDRFFQAWLRDVAKARDAQGVVILLCLDPGRVQVDFHKNLYAAGHRQAEHAAIRDAALPALKRKDFDTALAAMVATVDAKLSAEPAPRSSSPPPPVARRTEPGATQTRPVPSAKPAEDGLPLAWIVFGGIGLLVLVAILWIVSQAGTEHRPMNQPPRRNLDVWPPVQCPYCGAKTRREICESCGRAVRRDHPAAQLPPQQASQPAAPGTQTGGIGGFDLLTGMLLGQALGGSHHQHHHEESRRDSSSPPHDDGGGFGDLGGGFGGGGFDGGGDFSGGSGGDF